MCPKKLLILVFSFLFAIGLAQPTAILINEKLFLYNNDTINNGIMLYYKEVSSFEKLFKEKPVCKKDKIYKQRLYCFRKNGICVFYKGLKKKRDEIFFGINFYLNEENYEPIQKLGLFNGRINFFGYTIDKNTTLADIKSSGILGENIKLSNNVLTYSFDNINGIIFFEDIKEDSKVVYLRFR